MIEMNALFTVFWKHKLH